MKAVIYARYSSDNQREESIEGQIRECNEYAERNGIMVLCSYIDRALSARTADRPDFQRMIRDSEKGLFDVVLVWKLDRFSRDRYDSAHYKHILKKNGVKVLSANWISRFKYGNADDPDYQKQIIDTFINSIYVFDDKLLFTYNFKDGTEPITLSEIEAAFGSDLEQVAPPNRNGDCDTIAASFRLPEKA